MRPRHHLTHTAHHTPSHTQSLTSSYFTPPLPFSLPSRVGESGPCRSSARHPCRSERHVQHQETRRQMPRRLRRGRRERRRFFSHNPRWVLQRWVLQLHLHCASRRTELGLGQGNRREIACATATRLCCSYASAAVTTRRCHKSPTRRARPSLCTHPIFLLLTYTLFLLLLLLPTLPFIQHPKR